MRPRLFPASAAIPIMLALSLSACSDNDPKTGAPTSAAAQKDTLEFAATRDIRDINPHLYLGEMAAQSMVFEPLVVNTDKGVAPWLAQSWTLSEDAKTYTFRLREGVKFTDGTPLTAQVVKANFDAILANRERHAWLDLVNEIDKTEAVDEHTFRLTLKHAYFPALIELGLPRPFRMISPACMKDGQTKNGVTCLSGTGPWKLDKHEPRAYAVFARNETYWGNAPAIASIRWNVMPDPQTILMALKAKEMDLVYAAGGDQLAADAFKSLETDKTLRTLLSEPKGSRAILLNSNRPILSDIAVREALQRAFNRQNVVDGILNGIEAPAETLFARNVPGCDIALAPRPYDPDDVKRRLDAAGWKTGPNGIREKNGEPLSLVFVFNAENAQEKRIAQSVQSDLLAVGVELKLEGEETQNYLDRTREGDFDLAYALSWGAPYDPQSYLSSWRYKAHGDYQALLGLKDRDQLVADITAYLIEPDEQKRSAVLARVLSAVHESAVYLPISYARAQCVHQPWLEGVGFEVSQYQIPFEKMRLGARP